MALLVGAFAVGILRYHLAKSDQSNSFTHIHISILDNWKCT
jgi:hypothetical protein